MGIVGCGKISENHIKSAIKLNINITFLVDTNIDRVNFLVKYFDLKNVHIYSDFLQVFKDNLKVDFVSIATSSGFHFIIAKYFIENGFNVLIEKPATLSLHENDLLKQISLLKGVKVGVIHPNRFIESVNILKSALNNNEFGRIFSATLNIRLNRGEDYYNQAKWRGTWKYDGGGILLNQGLHNIDLFLWLLNLPIKKVTSKIKNLNHTYIETEDMAVSIIEFQSGALGIIEATSNIYMKNFEESLVITGSTGTVKLSGKSLSKIDYWNSEINPNINQPHNFFKIPNEPDLSNLHLPVFEDFLYSIQNNSVPRIPISEAKKSIELIYSIYLSSLEDHSVLFPTEISDSSFFEGKFQWK